MKANNIVLAGIGGQGIILASRLLAAAAMEQGCFVRTSETIGMSQRGGSVVSHIRIDGENKSSMIPSGQADLLIAFSPAEALRSLHLLKKDGQCVINGTSDEILSDFPKEYTFFLADGTVAADAAGSRKTLNVAMIGAAVGCGALDFTLPHLIKTIETIVPARFVPMNTDALKRGCSLVSH